jgi:hypothetical protein
MRPSISLPMDRLAQKALRSGNNAPYSEAKKRVLRMNNDLLCFYCRYDTTGIQKTLVCLRS